jgi:hypothetical protein
MERRFRVRSRQVSVFITLAIGAELRKNGGTQTFIPARRASAGLPATSSRAFLEVALFAFLGNLLGLSGQKFTVSLQRFRLKRRCFQAFRSTLRRGLRIDSLDSAATALAPSTSSPASARGFRFAPIAVDDGRDAVERIVAKRLQKKEKNRTRYRD